MTRPKSVNEGPAANSWRLPRARLSSSVPGWLAPPVRNTSPVPNTTSIDASGSALSQCLPGTVIGSRSRNAASTDFAPPGANGWKVRSPCGCSAVFSAGNVTPGSMMATASRPSTWRMRSIALRSTMTHSWSLTVSPRRRGPWPELTGRSATREATCPFHQRLYVAGGPGRHGEQRRLAAPAALIRGEGRKHVWIGRRGEILGQRFAQRVGALARHHVPRFPVPTTSVVRGAQRVKRAQRVLILSRCAQKKCRGTDGA